MFLANKNTFSASLLFIFFAISNYKLSANDLKQENLTLYYTKTFSSFANRILINELSIPVKFEKVNLFFSNKKVDGKKYSDINPRQPLVPMLKISNNKYLVDASVISLYLLDKYDKSNILMKKDNSLEKYKILEIMNFVLNDIQNDCILLLHPGYKFSKDTKKYISDGLEEKLYYLNNILIGDKKYIINDRFTIADMFIFTSINWIIYLKYDINKWPNIKRYYKYLQDKKSISDSMTQEGVNRL